MLCPLLLYIKDAYCWTALKTYTHVRTYIGSGYTGSTYMNYSFGIFGNRAIDAYYWTTIKRTLEGIRNYDLNKGYMDSSPSFTHYYKIEAIIDAFLWTIERSKYTSSRFYDGGTSVNNISPFYFLYRMEAII